MVGLFKDGMKEKVAEGVNIILLFIPISMMLAAPKRQQLCITSVEEQVDDNNEDIIRLIRTEVLAADGVDILWLLGSTDLVLFAGCVMD